MEQEIHLGVSQRGRETLLYRGYEYWKKRSNTDGTVIWRCVKSQTFHCKGMLRTKLRDVIGAKDPEHTHEGNHSTALARQAVGMMKQNVVGSGQTPSLSASNVMACCAPHVLMALPPRQDLSRTLRRTRQVAASQGRPQMPPIPTDTTFEMPGVFKDFVLFDSEGPEDRMLIFGCRDLLNGLSRASVWIADGTFKIVPSIFFQVYTLHFEYANGVSPVGLYCLLPNKTRQTYDRLISAMKDLMPNAKPETVLVDFEMAAMQAFVAGYPSTQVRGCFFHLSQCVIRRVQMEGLKAAYEADDELRGFIRCMVAISHVPLQDVVAVFDELLAQAPEQENVDLVITYFERTFIRGRRLPGRGINYAPPLFAHDLWNHNETAVEGMSRTTNISEGWHHVVQSLLQCDHPTLWRFIEGMQKENSRQLASYLQAVAGAQHLASRKYRRLRDKVMRAVANYDRGNAMNYLRAIAHLSFS